MLHRRVPLFLLAASVLILGFSSGGPSGDRSTAPATVAAGPTTPYCTVTAAGNLTSCADVPSTFSGYLGLSSRGITHIKPGVFSHLGAVAKLDLGLNSVAALDPGSFDGLTSLTWLSLGSNALTELKAGTLAGLSALETLAFDSNRIVSIEPGTFDGLTALSFLALDRNLLPVVGPRVVAGLSALTYLGLTMNRIASIDEHAFAGLSALATLSLDHNRLTSVEAGVLAGLTALTSLTARNNQIQAIGPGSFAWLAALNSLDLSYNLLSALDEGTFAGLSALTTLSLKINHIASLGAGTFTGLVNVTSLDLSLNALTSLESYTFSALEGLTTLTLTSNAIARIEPATFAGLSALTTLDLSKNELPTIGSGAFSGLTALQTLLLSSNMLVSIEAGAFTDLETLIVLDIASNPKLEIIDVDAFPAGGMPAVSNGSLWYGNEPVSNGCPPDVCRYVLDLGAATAPTCTQVGAAPGEFLASDMTACSRQGCRHCAKACPRGSFCPATRIVPSPCAAGSYGGAAGLSFSNCSGPCAAGHWCPAGSVNNTANACAAGLWASTGGGKDAACEGAVAPGRWSNAGSAASSAGDGACRAGFWGGGGSANDTCAGTCVAGRYGAGGSTSAQCDGPCEAGWYCPAASTTAREHECPAGSFCVGGSAAPSLCPAGSYGSATGLSALSCSGPCAAGHWCASGATDATANACAAGLWSAAGGGVDAACEGRVAPGRWSNPGAAASSAGDGACRAGFWGGGGSANDTCAGACVAGRYGAGGSTSAQCDGPCEAGWYCPAASTTARQHECPAGSFCVGGVGTPTECPAGTYGTAAQAVSQATGCAPCPAGTTCDGTGTTAPTPCPANHFQPNPGQMSHTACIECLPGFTAPAGSTLPTDCVAPRVRLTVSRVTAALVAVGVVVAWAALKAASWCATRRLRRLGKTDALGEPRRADYTRLLTVVLAGYHFGSDLFFVYAHAVVDRAVLAASTSPGRDWGLMGVFAAATLASATASVVVIGRAVARESRENAEFRRWLTRNRRVAASVIVLACLSGKVGSLALLSCGAFGAAALSAPMRRSTLASAGTASAVVAIAEDLPQLVVAVVWSATHGGEGAFWELSNISAIACAGGSLLVQGAVVALACVCGGGDSDAPTHGSRVGGSVTVALGKQTQASGSELAQRLLVKPAADAEVDGGEAQADEDGDEGGARASPA